MAVYKLNCVVRPGVTVQVEAETQKELFAEYASAHEVFGEKACGLCGDPNIRPAVRNVTQGKKSYDFCEYHCTNPKCNARLSLGAMLDEVHLFPHRRLTDEGEPSREKGTYGRHNGWTKFKGKKKEEGDA